MFACPHCSLVLRQTSHGAACDNGHSFDRAREGYLNLLVGGRIAGTAVPGDTPDSLAARRRFLSAGWYQPVVDALAQAIGHCDGPVLDIGCGEGHYLSQVRAPSRAGIDISKRAIQMASRLVPSADFAVASAFRLPVLDGSCAVVYSVFSPHSFEEISRVLRLGGHWVTITPGPNHLREMRPDNDHQSGSRPSERFERRNDPPPEASTSQRLTFSLNLSPEAAHDLFSMTPLRWQAGARTTVSHAVTVDMWVSRGLPKI